MVQAIHVGSGGAYVNALDEVHVGASGAYVDLDEVWVGDGGAWVQVFSKVVVTAPSELISSVGPSIATAAIRINSDGTYDQEVNGVYTYLGDWITPTSAADSTYDVRITNVVFTVGTSFYYAAAAEDSWVGVSTSPRWQVRDAVSTPVGETDVSFDIEIRKDGGATLSSGNNNLWANYDIS